MAAITIVSGGAAPSGECLRVERHVWCVKLCDQYPSASEVSFSQLGTIQIYLPSGFFFVCSHMFYIVLLQLSAMGNCRNSGSYKTSTLANTDHLSRMIDKRRHSFL